MKRQNPLIQFISLVCIILGSLTLSLLYITSWANKLIYDTNYYLSIVTPLPQNSDVAKALSTYTVDTLISNTNIQQKVTNALPDNEKFLSSSLSDNLINKSYQLTTNIIQTDQFQSVWVAANTLFHRRVLAVVRGGGIVSEFNNKQFLQGTSFEFDGSQLIQTIKNNLGSESELINNQQVQQAKSLTLPIFTKLIKIRQIVYWISQLAAMLLPLSLALILYGIATSFSRQKGFLVTGIFIASAMLLTLVTLQIIKTDALNHITQPVYYSAADVVWNSFFAGLKQSLRLTLLGGLLLIFLALVFGPNEWATNFRKAVGFTQMQRRGFMTSFMKFRVSFAHFAIWLYLLGIIVAATILLTTTNISIANVVIILSVLLLYFSLLLFLFPRNKAITK